jgi:uncharacterized protein
VTIAMVIDEIRTDIVTRAGTEAGRVELAEANGRGRRLQIVMGRAEARAIDDGRRGETPPRPLAWDLLRSAVEALGGHVVAVVVTEVEEGRLFRAEVVLRQGDTELRIPARPSDGLALAVRCPSASIEVADDVLDAAALPGPEDPVAPDAPEL